MIVVVVSCHCFVVEESLRAGDSDGSLRSMTTLKSQMTNSADGKSTAVHPAVDTVAAMLYTLGRYAIDLEGMSADAVRLHADGWARHVLTGSPPPSTSPLPKGARQWGGVRDFTVQVCRGQQDYAVTHINELRQALWKMLQGLRTALEQNEAADLQVDSQLTRLMQALASDSIDTLKREVHATVTLVGQAAEERHRRQSSQIDELAERLTTLRVELAQARKEMALDSMTRLYNRASFDQHLTKTLELCHGSGQAACLLIVDIDRFKVINDTYGHPTGDAVIRLVAETLTRSFPRKNDFVARYAGDEFAVILAETPVDNGQSLAQKLMEAVRSQTITTETGTKGRVTLSAGLTGLHRNDTAATWLARADAALYRAKQAGRDQISVST
ncbi:GGDEF domain-containing protein [Gammaproteobacteria bacterium]